MKKNKFEKTLRDRGFKVTVSTKPPELLPLAPLTIGSVTTKKVMLLLRKLILEKRWNDQGGFASYDAGHWAFVSTGLGQVTPKELDLLCKFTGIVPDEIVPRGPCSKCKFARDGNERGYEMPCLSCTRPYHSHFQPKT